MKGNKSDKERPRELRYSGSKIASEGWKSGANLTRSISLGLI